MYAIFGAKGNQVTDRFSNKSHAWDDYLERNPAANRRYDSRSQNLARLRREGFYCDYAYSDMPKVKVKSKAKPVAKAATATHAVINFEQKVERTITLDLAFAKAMHTFFKKKQDAGEIEYVYEYKDYGSEKDAEKFIEHMTEFLRKYKG